MCRCRAHVRGWGPPPLPGLFSPHLSRGRGRGSGFRRHSARLCRQRSPRLVRSSRYHRARPDVGHHDRGHRSQHARHTDARGHDHGRSRPAVRRPYLDRDPRGGRRRRPDRLGEWDSHRWAQVERAHRHPRDGPDRGRSREPLREHVPGTECGAARSVRLGGHPDPGRQPDLLDGCGRHAGAHRRASLHLGRTTLPSGRGQPGLVPRDGRPGDVEPNSRVRGGGGPVCDRRGSPGRIAAQSRGQHRLAVSPRSHRRCRHRWRVPWQEVWPVHCRRSPWCLSRRVEPDDAVARPGDVAPVPRVRARDHRGC